MKTKITLFFALLSASLFAQTANDTIIFSELGHYYYSFTPFQSWSVYSPLIDRLGRDYVYTASVDLGEVTFHFDASTGAVTPIDTIAPAILNNDLATFLAQDADTLFVAYGGFQAGSHRAGLATFDVTNPASPVLLDKWDSAAYTHGCAQVVIQGNYAYLGAMNDGVIILDISDKHNIRFVSNIVPTTNPNMLSGCHARGLFISHDTLLVAYDGGGLRVIDVTNKYAPVQSGVYLNAAACANNNRPYYNHVFRLGDQAYVALDYRGFEVDNVSSPANITNTTWDNVWNNNTFGSWNGSDGHANEIAYSSTSTNVLMMSGGDSQVFAIDPTNPSQPRIMGAWGPANTDNLGAWGVDVFGNYVALGIIKTPVPFASDSGGLQILNWNLVLGVDDQSVKTGQLKMYPNPASENCTVELPVSTDKIFTIEVVDVMGRVVKTQTADPALNGRNADVDLSEMASGVYTIRVTSENVMYTGRVVKQ